ncbi:unnamed protein product [Amoebophrya sp. A25]|nr:unnamed protein product [Amoebophrya sp. A25]|eukprot:GSA25T00022126001.1
MSGGGPSILLTTSLDPAYPEENMLDPNEKTFWLSTGMFPQEILMQIGGHSNAMAGIGGSIVRIASTGIRELRLEVSKDETEYPVNFATQDTLRLDNTAGSRLQHTELQVPQARFLKLVILSGYSEFPSVHKLEVS